MDPFSTSRLHHPSSLQSHSTKRSRSSISSKILSLFALCFAVCFTHSFSLSTTPCQSIKSSLLLITTLSTRGFFAFAGLLHMESPPFIMTASTTEASPSPPVIDLCFDHDLTLNIKTDNGPTICRYRVAKPIMCIASPVWRAMLTGKFMEASVQNREIPFVDDDPEALLTVLRIAHHRTHEVTKVLELGQLVSIATVCDKYDTVAMCRPYIENWVRPFIAEQPESQPPYLRPGWEAWLWCAWVFGYEETFRQLVSKLQAEICTDEEGSCLAPTGLPRRHKVLEANMPPEITGKILLFLCGALNFYSTSQCFHPYMLLSLKFYFRQLAQCS